MAEQQRKKKIAGRSQLARVAHLRSGAGAMGGNRKQQVRRRRRDDHQQEARAARGEKPDE